MNKLPALAALYCALVAGCGSKDDQMVSAIQETLTALSAKDSLAGSACLPLPLPDTVVPDAQGQHAPIFADSPVTSATLQILASHGLLRPEAPGRRGEPRFGLTADGITYLRHEGHVKFPAMWRWALCTGVMKVTKIESYTKPADVFGQTVTSVNYRYVVDGAADWAKDAQVQVLDPWFARHFQQPVSSMDLVQTNQGWRSIYMQQREAGLVK